MVTRVEAKRILRQAFPEKNYELLEEVGRGGQGAVWRVSGTDIPAVIKMTATDPSAELGLNEAQRQAWRETANRNAAREVEALKRFSASALFPTLLDARVWVSPKGGKVYLLLEEELLPLLPTAYCEARMSAAELAARVGYSGCKAIMDLEEAHFTYRDVKCQNIMLRRTADREEPWQVVFIDLGAAKEYKSTYGGESVIIGTEGHIAPERLRGSMVIPSRADIFSLGITLLEIVSGKYLYLKDEEARQCEIRKRFAALRAEDSACGAMYDLIGKMVRVSPILRISPGACLREWEKLLPKKPDRDPEWQRSTARRALEAAKRGNEAEACRFMGKLPETDKRRYLLQALTAENGTSRLQALRRAALLGSPAGCFYLSLALFGGECIRQDIELGRNYLKIAASAGYPPALALWKELQTGGKRKLPGSGKSRIQYLLDEIAA